MNGKQHSTIFRLGFLLCLVTALFAQTPTQQSSEEQKVLAKGMGAIIGGDEAKAYDDALANALRNAVEQVIGTMVQSDVLVENYQVVEDRIYSRTMGYVKSYETVSSTKRGDNILEVTIQAVVKKGDLENDLNAIGLLIRQKNKPRLMVLIEEQNMDRYYHSYAVDLNTTETELTNKFLEKGFTFVDKNVVAHSLQKDAILAAIEGDAAMARAIASESGAEVLIIGKAIAKPASGGPSVLKSAGMVSCQATINLRAVQADNGRIIATTSQHAAAAHIDQMTGGTQALQKAAALAAEDLSRKILESWRSEVYSSNTVQLRILNIPSFRDFVKFKNMVKTYVRGVQNIYQRDYSANTGLLELETRGTTNQIAEELVLKDFSPYQVQVVNTTANAIIIKLSLK
ncbi:MAG: hypothetical protein D6748_00170 [Calditrichaeota bacterium]|nr:MAG: hypothetical protein D6748_00170 [Calditrichota bacterium]